MTGAPDRPGAGEPGSVDPFEAPPRRPEPDILHVDVEGYEGPLDLLLDLARREKVDLTRIAILPLAEQYLAFVAEAKNLKIELAADILVMAAWLAYLKSRLIAPQEAADEPSGDELADELAFRLRRLEAMRTAADRLFALPRLGHTVFARGSPEVATVRRRTSYRASLYDLLAAYGAVRQGEIVRDTTVDKRPVFSLVDARAIMERVVGAHGDWFPLERLLAAMPAGEDRRAVVASTFGAALEMAREGRLSVRQAGPFAPLYLKPATPAADRGEAESGKGEGE